MVKTIIEIRERQNKILNIIKEMHRLKNNNEAITFVLEDYEGNLEQEVRPEYVRKIRRIDKQKGIPFKNIQELRDMIERD